MLCRSHCFVLQAQGSSRCKLDWGMPAARSLRSQRRSLPILAPMARDHRDMTQSFDHVGGMRPAGLLSGCWLQRVS